MKEKAYSIVVGSVIWLILGPTAQAQELATNSADQATQLAEVVVTAEKRTENLQEVPETVTAIQPEELANRDVASTTDLVQLVPTLTYTEGAKAANDTFRIRGIGSQLFNWGAEASVSTVIDGVVLAKGAESFSDIGNVQQVEVLEGPQGYLFGKNATAGVINITTLNPTKDYEATADATFAEFGEYRQKAMISGPLTGSLSMLLSGYDNEVRGNLYNLAYHIYDNDYHGSGGVAKLEWDTNENMTWVGEFNVSGVQSQCCKGPILRYDNAGQPPQNPGITANFGNQDIYDFQQVNDDRHMTIGSLKGDMKVGDYTVTSITAYQTYGFSSDYTKPSSGSAVGNGALPIYVSSTGGRSLVYSAGGPGDVRQVSQELRLTTPVGQRVTFVGGLYYEDAYTTRRYLQYYGSCVLPASSPLQGTPCPAGIPNQPSNSPNGLGGWSSTVANNWEDTEQVAIFEQGSVKVTDSFDLLLGARLQRETLSYANDQTTIPGTATTTISEALGVGYGSTAATGTSGKIGLQYHLAPNSQAYVTYAKGFKGPAYGIESGSYAVESPVKPEVAHTGEAGVKLDLLDNRLTVNAAAYYEHYSNLQIQATVTDPVTLISSTQPINAGSVDSRGFEVSMNALLMRGLTVNASASWNQINFDANGLPCTYEQTYLAALGGPAAYGLPPIALISTGGLQPYNACYQQQIGTNATTGAKIYGSNLQNVRNGTLPNSPEFKGIFSLNYDRALFGNFSGFVGGTLNGQSGMSLDQTLSQDPYENVPGYYTVDLDLGVHTDHFRGMLFAKNITNQLYYDAYGRTGTGTRIGTVPVTAVVPNPEGVTGTFPKGARRYFGLEVSYSLK